MASSGTLGLGCWLPYWLIDAWWWQRHCSAMFFEISACLLEFTTNAAMCCRDGRVAQHQERLKWTHSSATDGRPKHQDNKRATLPNACHHFFADRSCRQFAMPLSPSLNDYAPTLPLHCGSAW
ncbi:hypothetical protein TRVL_08083 [Trypanosoma vivax]|nr:hypothetical protein TRVL_08083 [Trypanosoma vivax]